MRVGPTVWKWDGESLICEDEDEPPPPKAETLQEGGPTRYRRDKKAKAKAGKHRLSATGFRHEIRSGMYLPRVPARAHQTGAA